MITFLNHESILLSSNDGARVKHLYDILKNISAEDIKKNKVKGRICLMKKLVNAGNCPLAKEYFATRAGLNTEANNLSAEWKNHSTYPFKRSKILSQLIKSYAKTTGWCFTYGGHYAF